MIPMSAVDFQITFNGPFRVSTGYARAGLDAAIDIENPLPNTSLKGVMRATATQLLGEESAVVKQVFGSVEHEAPWRWGHATPGGSGWHTPKPAARVAIDADTHTAAPDMLGISEQTSAAHAFFTVTQRYPLDENALRAHRLALAVAGQATRSLGANRRRGLGWVTITCTNVSLDRAAIDEFLTLRSA
ncbi:hypothetical protein SAMN02982929_00962 [Saccharopolyspora kobensis]|uniref:CRISPR type III-associated protein domain-containing protein n=2 Tax=Saccharopolyspora kobensis TaxID=146035 RepID=A0A1H5VR60_9PSEU|nr:hypothetical protein SAMN02982929_00962 [Saccharopolyspora kobensis]SFC57884.1 hypothetical protein SAMN05216506_1011108 [Saccharopolyspora kobensis]